MREKSWQHTWTVLGDDTIDDRRLDTVDNIIAGARHEITVAEDLYIVLESKI